jgi:hypothetical protein
VEWLAIVVAPLREVLLHTLKRGHRRARVGVIGQQNRHGALDVHVEMIPITSGAGNI